MIIPEWEKGGTMTTLDIKSGDAWTSLSETAIQIGSLGTKTLSKAVFMSAEVLLASSNFDAIGNLLDGVVLQGAVYQADASGTVFRVSGEINIANIASNGTTVYDISAKVALNLETTNSNYLKISIDEVAGAVTTHGATNVYAIDKLKIRNIRLIFN